MRLLTSEDMLVELLRRYSNRPDLLGPLVSVLRRIEDPGEEGHETVTTIEGRTASPDYVRQILSEHDITELIAAYRSGATAKMLAERYGVHTSTIKKKLRKHGVRRQARDRGSSSSSSTHTNATPERGKIQPSKVTSTVLAGVSAGAWSTRACSALAK
jgi:transposase-like protein